MPTRQSDLLATFRSLMYVFSVSFKLPCWCDCPQLRMSLLLCAQYSTITRNHYSQGGGGGGRGDPPLYSHPCHGQLRALLQCGTGYQVLLLQ